MRIEPASKRCCGAEACPSSQTTVTNYPPCQFLTCGIATESVVFGFNWCCFVSGAVVVGATDRLIRYLFAAFMR